MGYSLVDCDGSHTKIKIIYNGKVYHQILNDHIRFDFYLIDYNVLIEYDGRQHFKSIEHWGGEEEFKKRKINDSIKEEYCKNNRIPLLRISYHDNVLEKLSEFFF